MNNFLDTLSVASPCTADWNEMSGDDRKRFCGLCQLNVYNLSDMTRAEAEALVTGQEGRMCVRFFRRADGTVLTRDCPVGLKALHRRRIRKWGTMAAAVTLMTVVGIFTAPAQAKSQVQNHVEIQGRPMMGAPALPPQPSAHTMGEPVMGDVALPQQPPESQEPPEPLKHPQPKTHQPEQLMGKIKMPD